jgi:FtsH-binding integral membrane protein
MRKNLTISDARSMELSEFMSHVFAMMAAGLFITASVGYLIALDEATLSWLFHTYEGLNDEGETVRKFAASGWWWGAAAVQLVMVLFMASFGRVGHVPLFVGTPLFLCFAALNGVTLAPVLYAYTAVSVAKVFLITAIAFTACAIWGWTTKRDLTGLGSFFLYALIGLLVALVVNLFFQSPLMDYGVSILAVLLFAALTTYDMQMLRELHAQSRDHSGLVVSGALALYLDFLNMFLHLLRLFGVKTSD